jgi:Kelch motif
MAHLLPDEDDDWETESDVPEPVQTKKDESFLWAHAPAKPAEWPAARHSATLTVLPGSNQQELLLCGGSAYRRTFNDFYALSCVAGEPIRWRELAVEGAAEAKFEQVWGGTATYFPDGDFVLLFGGACVGSDGRSEVFRLDSSLRMTRLDVDGAVPPPRAYHGACRLGKDHFVVFGGRDGDDDLWVLTLGGGANTWERVVVENNLPPPPRKEMALACFGEKLLLFGGCELKRHHYMNDVWVFSFATKTWEKIPATGAGVDPVGGHCFGVFNDKMLVCYGGRSGNGSYPTDILFCSSVDSPSWVTTTGTGRKPGTGVTYAASCPLGGRLVIFGGQVDDRSGPDSETADLRFLSV